MKYDYQKEQKRREKKERKKKIRKDSWTGALKEGLRNGALGFLLFALIFLVTPTVSDILYPPIKGICNCIPENTTITTIENTSSGNIERIEFDETLNCGHLPMNIRCMPATFYDIDPGFYTLDEWCNMTGDCFDENYDLIIKEEAQETVYWI